MSVEKRRQDFFRDITTLIRSFKNKLKIEGYFKNLEEKESKKKAVEITYAYIIQFILYKTLVDNDFDDFAKEFKKRNGEIYDCLKTNNYGKILGIIGGISDKISKNIYRPFEKEQKFINEMLLNLFHRPKNYLHDVSPWLDIFVFIRNYNFSNIKNEIFGYIYENYLKELYEETKKGQYFTDPSVVNFMLEQIGYTKENLIKRLKSKPEEEHISIIDPSCGSGTFLYSAVDRIIDAVPNGSEETSKKIEELVNNNVFGLDIAEFPLYLAEMNILMRLLPLIINEKYNNPIDKKIKIFKTRDSVSEFLDTEIRNTMHDIVGQLSLLSSKKVDLDYASFMREKTDLEEMKKSLEKHPNMPRKRFDFVIGNPPYVSYNECSKQEVLIVKFIQDKKVQMSDIYGVNLNTVPGRIKAYAPKPNLYSFFIALGLALLKDNGRICYIIPQTILTANDLDVLRFHLAKFTTIDKIITFSGNMFIGRGLKQNKAVATSSLVFVIKRAMPNIATHQVDIVHYKNPKDDLEKCLKNISLGKGISKKRIKQHDLLVNLANWNFIKHDKITSDFIGDYKKNDSFDIYRIPEISRQKFNSIFYFDKGLVFPKNKIEKFNDKKYKDNYFHLIKSEKDKYRLILTKEVINQDSIGFPKGSQGIDVYNKKYKIVWSYMNSSCFYYTDEKNNVEF